MLGAILLSSLVMGDPAVEKSYTPSRIGRVSSTAVAGTGMALAPGPGGPLARRSPTQLTLDAAFRHPEFQWLEVSPAAMLELDNRVGFGLALRVRGYVPVKKFDLYVQAGVPAFLAPYWLIGVQLGFGAAIPVHPRFAFVFEPVAHIFFFGNDLTESGVMAKLDIYGGIRVTF